LSIVDQFTRSSYAGRYDGHASELGLSHRPSETLGMQGGVHDQIRGGVDGGGIANQTHEHDVVLQAHLADAGTQRLPIARRDIPVQVATGQDQQRSRGREPSPGRNGDMVAMHRVHVPSDGDYLPALSNAKPIAGNLNVESGRLLNWIRYDIDWSPTS
jgi:hypothetical protein